MFGLFADLLEFFYDVWPSYGAMIILLTLTVMVVLTPLTLKGTRSMMMMQLAQPEMKRLQAEYRDDKQKLNEEMLKFYKENGINPLSGCLPLLIQMPVFIILYRVIHALTGINAETGNFDPDYISTDSELYTNLASTNEMNWLLWDLARSPVEVMGDSFGEGLLYLLLVFAVAATSIIQQRQISGRNPAAASNPQQQLLMKLGPIMITFFSLIVPTAMVLYFLVSNLYRVGQQQLITHTIYKTPEAQKLREQQLRAAEDRAKKSASGPKKGFFEGLLGDAAPRLNEAKGRSAPAGNGGSTGKTAGNGAKKPVKGGGQNRPSAGPNRPSGGRTTPAGSRGSGRRKKRRK